MLYPTTQAHQERDHGANQENHEQDFRDAGRADRDAAEAEERGDQRDDEKYYGIVKHSRPYLVRS